jgi:glycosyltransferase involved in cell wall biosynthesis
MVKIAWLSSRVLGVDLCSTTQINLANGLVEKGHDVFMYSPGKIKGIQFEHIETPRSKIRGLQAFSIRRSLARKIREIESADVILIDWPLASLMKKTNKKIILIDRGPPAYRGLLARMQWPYWKKAWNKARQGTTVSSAHKQFVMENTNTTATKIEVIQAGVDCELFHPQEKDTTLHMVYHGSLDENRAIMSLPSLLTEAKSAGLDIQLHLHGQGDCLDRLHAMHMDGLEVTSRLDQKDLANRLGGYDIGILPMPEHKVWNLASPLKLSEYLASGLIVAGVDHSGHRMNDTDGFVKLFDESDLISSIISWLQELDSETLRGLQEKARKKAENDIGWSKSVDILEELIISTID